MNPLKNVISSGLLVVLLILSGSGWYMYFTKPVTTVSEPEKVMKLVESKPEDNPTFPMVAEMEQYESGAYICAQNADQTDEMSVGDFQGLIALVVENPQKNERPMLTYVNQTYCWLPEFKNGPYTVYYIWEELPAGFGRYNVQLTLQ